MISYHCIVYILIFKIDLLQSIHIFKGPLFYFIVLVVSIKVIKIEGRVSPNVTYCKETLLISNDRKVICYHTPVNIIFQVLRNKIFKDLSFNKKTIPVFNKLGNSFLDTRYLLGLLPYRFIGIFLLLRQLFCDFCLSLVFLLSLNDKLFALHLKKQTIGNEKKGKTVMQILFNQLRTKLHLPSFISCHFTWHTKG